MRLILRVALPAVALGVVALVWWLPQRAPTTVASPRDVEASMTQAPASTPSSIVDEPNQTAQTPVTPPRDVPLDRLWSTLQRPAQAGDAGAACRLAIETLRCVGAVRMAAVLTASPAAEPGELQTLLARHHYGCSDQILDMNFHKLREKVHPLGVQIETLRGLGYRLHMQPSTASENASAPDALPNPPELMRLFFGNIGEPIQVL